MKGLKYLLFVIGLAVLYYLSQINYLLFHSSLELVSVSISFSVFIISTFSYNKEKNSFSLLGIGYLCVSILDILHTLSYHGMNIFPDDIYYANQLWVVARLFEAITLLLFLIDIDKIYKRFRLIVIYYITLLTIFLLSILYFKNFPTCFIDGYGQTTFKIALEYIIVGILLVALYVLYRKSTLKSIEIKKDIFTSILLTILSELSFTTYSDNYGFTNVIGHLFKILSFYFIYKSILLNNVKKPLNIIFEKLKQKEDRILELLKQLEIEKEVAVKQSLTDGLTAIPNRRFLDTSFTQLYNRAKRYKHSIAVFMIDIDFFKNYNDLYGHLQGDKCLIQVSKLLKSQLKRDIDIIARYGGEEFVLLFENTDKEGAITIAERIKTSMDNLNIPHEESSCANHVTLSIGIFIANDVSKFTEDSLILNADNALYQVKSTSRNAYIIKE